MGLFDALKKVDTELQYKIASFSTILSLVKSWKPKHYNSEAAYQNDLLKYLNDQLYTKSGKEKSVKIKRTRGDIVIGNIAIELKYNAISTGAFDRLASQIERYKKVYNGGIVLVFCGRTDKELLNKYKNKLLWWGSGLTPIKIVEK